MEILRQHAGPLEAIFVPVGGGGLISGIAAYVKRVRPSIKVVGVEPVDAAAMTQSLKKGRRVKLEHVGLFADGVAVKEVGRETFRLCRELVDEMVLADTDAMCAAIKDVFEDTRVVLEPAGALAIAGAKAWVERHGARGKALVAVASGANTNFDRLRFIAEEAELGEHRAAILAVTIPERPGSFKKFCAQPGALMQFLQSMRSDWNISLFHYRNHGADYGRVLVGMQVPSREMRQFRRFLENLGYPYAEETRNPAYRLFLV